MIKMLEGRMLALNRAMSEAALALQEFNFLYIQADRRKVRRAHNRATKLIRRIMIRARGRQ